jgi:hypothetical protein
LHVNPAQFKGAHFATYPIDLVLPCLLAGTSAKGCCPICGAPWERETEREFRTQNDCSEVVASRRQKTTCTGWDGFPRGTTHTNTLGWHPTCDHDAEPVPCIVLDPFAGSGTTGEACRTVPHPRRFVGLDLNGDYLSDFALPRAERKQTADSIAELPLFATTEVTA